MPSGRKPTNPYISTLEKDAARRRAHKESTRRQQFASGLASVTDRLVNAGLKKQSQTRWTETEKLETALDFLRQLKTGNEALTAKLNEYLPLAAAGSEPAAFHPQQADCPPIGTDQSYQWPAESSSSSSQWVVSSSPTQWIPEYSSSSEPLDEAGFEGWPLNHLPAPVAASASAPAPANDFFAGRMDVDDNMGVLPPVQVNNVVPTYIDLCDDDMDTLLPAPGSDDALMGAADLAALQGFINNTPYPSQPPSLPQLGDTIDPRWL